MTTLHYTAATSKGQQFPVEVAVDGRTTLVSLAGHPGQRLRLVNGSPVVSLLASTAKALLGATLADYAGVLRLSHDYTKALAEVQAAEAGAARQADYTAWAAENPAEAAQVLASRAAKQAHQAIWARIEQVMNHD